jgi:general secretion pathway protein A
VYEAFFGLVDAPFRLTPDPRFLFLSAKHAEALAHLRLGLTEPGGFVCITGEIGTGKTTVLRSFLADLGPEVSTAFIFNPTLSWEDLLRRIARELGVPAAGTSHVDAMDALNAHLLAQRKDGRISVVVIDEAQAMPLEVLERLRLLSNLETSTEKLLRLVLVGQPQLARLLLDPALEQLNQRITLRWHLRPLTRRETFTYVRHRLTVAGGLEASRLFTIPALRAVHRYSGGVPRLVNMIAHRATLAAYVKRRRRVDLSAVRAAYREIRAVPLATSSMPGRLGWVGGALAACVGLATIGLPKLGIRLDDVRLAPAPVSTPAEVSAVASASRTEAPAAVASRAEAPGVVASRAEAPAAVASRTETPGVAVPKRTEAAARADRAPSIEPPARDSAPAAVVAPAQVAAVAAVESPAPVAAPAPATSPPQVGAPTSDAVAEFERRLARLKPDRSLHDALENVLAAWHVAPLAGDEKVAPDTLDAIAHRRGLEDMKLTGNLSMLRLLDLPAVLEIRLPGTRESSFVTLSAIGSDEVALRAGGETLRATPGVLDRVWFGDAHVIWRDFEWLGPTFGNDAKGPHVLRLQRLLARAGVYSGAATGAFDTPTEAAVLGFQRSRRLDPDCRVGRLTRIALYGAAGGYRLPTLNAGGAS